MQNRGYGFREKLARWMYGRYGVDRMSKNLIFGAMIVGILSMFVPGYVGRILYYLCIAVFIYGYFRVFSKNKAKRYKEAAMYERFLMKVKRYPDTIKKEWTIRKTHHIYRCPSCRQKIKVPKGRGMIEVSCPKCRTAFRKKS